MVVETPNILETLWPEAISFKSYCPDTHTNTHQTGALPGPLQASVRIIDNPLSRLSP